ncbi:MAG: EamA family transporter [Lacibacter sp.]
MNSTKKAFLQLHIAVFLAGFTGVLGRLIEINEGWLVWYRLILASVMLFGYLYFTGKLVKLDRKVLLQCFFAGSLITLHWVLFYGSIKYANVSVALVCFAATGSFTSFLEPWINKHPFDVFEMILGLLVLVGIYFVFHFDTQYMTGILLGLGAAFLSALFPIYNRRLVQKIPDAKVITLYELIGGWFTLSFVLPFYLKLSPAKYSFPTTMDWLWLFILSLFCTIFVLHLAISSLKKISAFTANLTYNLEPVYGITLAFAIFHENRELNIGFYIGIAIVIFSVFAHSWRVWRKKA